MAHLVWFAFYSVVRNPARRSARRNLKRAKNPPTSQAAPEIRSSLSERPASRVRAHGNLTHRPRDLMVEPGSGVGQVFRRRAAADPPELGHLVQGHPEK